MSAAFVNANYVILPAHFFEMVNQCDSMKMARLMCCIVVAQ